MTKRAATMQFDTGRAPFRRPIPRSIMEATLANQIAKERRKMLETGHFNSFSNI